MPRSHRQAAALIAILLAIPPAARAVTMTQTSVNGIAVDLWTWSDATGATRSVALKREGAGNTGHGGYAVEFTYKAGGSTVTIDADPGNDGGFGYFVSHERYRTFADGTTNTIAKHIFHTDDSPLGRSFTATTAMPVTPPGTGAERFTIQYGHYGTIFTDPVNPNTGGDSTPLPGGQSNYAFYTLPATTTWVFQDGMDYPRIDVSIDLSKVIPPGGSAPTADLVSFDMRGPYGNMQFANDTDALVAKVAWADQEYLFTIGSTPVTRNTAWSWNVLNKGARFQALQAGGYEMGLYEPVNAASSATADGYSAERGYTSASFAAAGGKSYSSCGLQQILPSDGEWPYQSVQYSLPCGNGEMDTPTDGKKIAWGTVAYYGTSLTSAYNGQRSYPLAAFPASNTLAYSNCLVLGQPAKKRSLTAVAAGAYKGKAQGKACATTPVP